MNKKNIRNMLIQMSRFVTATILKIILIFIYYIGVGITVFLYICFKGKYKSLYQKQGGWNETEKKSLSMEDCLKQT